MAEKAKTTKKATTKKTTARKTASKKISLVIVESPAKARTINKYLGRNFKVLASVGHVKDLPKSKLGVEVDNDFKPQYVTIKGKAKTLGELKKAGKNAENIYLAPDPDREGEAIAWHIAEELGGAAGGAKIHRVLFNEITERAIKEAIKNPLPLDKSKFEAQQARRVLDRLVGYQVSPILWDKVRRGLSAGRVQSVAVRLICEREGEIKAFKAREYWSVTAILDGSAGDDSKEGSEKLFAARLVKKGGKKLELATEDETKGALKEIEGKDFEISKIEKKERKKNPQPPFITSRLQQEASRKLGFTAKRTMAVAQQLYEGIEVGSEGPLGLITYMRTDSTRLAAEAVEAARSFIGDRYGADYLPPKAIHYKTKKSAQGGHEAIRPTNLVYPPEKIKSNLSSDQYRLYQLIWMRFISCQMSPAILDQTKVEIDVGEYLFQANGMIVKFPGFTAVYEEGTDVDVAEEDKEGRLPALTEKQRLEVKEITPRQHFTQPPPRFTEATLVKELEENGIGRPSTYAAIISTIQDREYVLKDGRTLQPTELGIVVTELLVKSFPKILDAKFTARLEEELDQVEEGKLEWLKVMREFYGPFKEDLERAKSEMKNVKAEEETTDLKCEKCGKPMIIKWGRKGKFLACTGYPECRSTSDYTIDDDGKVTPVASNVETDEKCEKCGKPMIIKSGRFGRFLACTGYPECKSTKALSTGVACPTDGCEGMLLERRTKRGRMFYGCSKYPKCSYATWKDPTKGDLDPPKPKEEKAEGEEKEEKKKSKKKIKK